MSNLSSLPSFGQSSARPLFGSRLYNPETFTPPDKASKTGATEERRPSRQGISPTEIKEHLDQYVIGQEPATQVLATAVHEHLLQQHIDGFTNGQIRKYSEQNAAPLRKALARYFEAAPGKKDDLVFLRTILWDVASLGKPEDVTEDLMKELLKGFLQDGNIRLKPGQSEEKAIRGITQSTKRLSAQIGAKLAEAEAEGQVPLKKNVVMTPGPSGSGKTQIMRAIESFLEQLGCPVPVVRYSASNLTEAGYVGGNIEDIAGQLYEKAGKDPQRAESGIVYLDEIDKLKAQDDYRGRDVSGRGPQGNLLSMLEDGSVQITDRANGKVNLNMGKVLFILGGAFTNLPGVIAKRLGLDEKRLPEEVAGQLYELATPEDLVESGMIPELMGRVRGIAPTTKPTREDYLKILTEPKDSPIRQIKRQLKADGVTINFTDDALEAIADRAYESSTGARALTTLVDKVAEKTRFNVGQLEGKTVTITGDTVREALEFDLDAWAASKGLKLQPKVGLGFESAKKPGAASTSHADEAPEPEARTAEA